MGKVEYDDLDKFLCCECHSTEHLIRFMVFDWGPKEPPNFEIHIALTKFSLWKRIWVAIKYIFGYQCRYGHFDEILFGDKQVEEIQKVINHYKNLRGKNDNEINKIP